MYPFSHLMNRAVFLTLALLLSASRLAAADFATEMMEATFKLDNQGSHATCFLMRREAPDPAIYLVTVAHALNGTKDETMVLVLRKPAPDGSYARLEHRISLRRGGQPQWVSHEKHDVAVLRLTEPLPVPVAALPVAVLADETRLKTAGVHLCSPLFALGYPQGLEADASGLPVARQGIFASPPLQPWRSRPTFLADCKLFPGNSGGPVFISGEGNHPLVVGLVFEQHYYVDELKGMYEERTIRNPLNLAIILRAEYIRDTLEAAAKQPQPPSK
jgi:hypothetical protein